MQLFNRQGTARTPNGGTDAAPTYSYRGRCGRCGGAGGSDAWAYTGYTCYDCGGSGIGPTQVEKLYTQERLDKLNATLAKRHAAAAAKRAAEHARIEAEKASERAAWREAHAEFLAKLDTLSRGRDEGDFWVKFERDFLARQGEPSERQREIVERELAKRARDAAARHVGKPGDRITVTLTTERVIDCSWGTYPRIVSYLHIARDEAGNCIVYKGAGDFPGEGQTLKVKATIKEHTTYNGIPQTVIARPKVLETEAA